MKHVFGVQSHMIYDLCYDVRCISPGFVISFHYFFSLFQLLHKVSVSLELDFAPMLSIFLIMYMCDSLSSVTSVDFLFHHFTALVFTGDAALDSSVIRLTNNARKECFHWSVFLPFPNCFKQWHRHSIFLNFIHFLHSP